MRLFSPTFKETCIQATQTIRDAINSLDRSGLLIVCVVNDSHELVGIVTDADIRRAMLHGKKLDDEISDIMNSSPMTASVDASSVDLSERSRSTSKREIPLLDGRGRLCDIYISGLSEVRKELSHSSKANSAAPKIETLDCWMFILAGGLGTRLREVVSDRPKPLAVVGGRPLIEHLITQASMCGIRKFYISLNYMAEQIIEFLSEPKFKEFKFEFIIEKERLGTAGSLSEIAGKINTPVLVCNADVLSNISFDQLLAHHLHSKAPITCAVRRHHVTVPFGVVEIEEGTVSKITEKPSFDVFINAGIYVLSPDCLTLVKKGQRLDMPDLIEMVISNGKKVSTFFMHEYWLDVGRPEDYRTANAFLNGEERL